MFGAASIFCICAKNNSNNDANNNFTISYEWHADALKLLVT